MSDEGGFSKDRLREIHNQYMELKKTLEQRLTEIPRKQARARREYQKTIDALARLCATLEQSD